MPKEITPLGRLQPVQLRDAWLSEPEDFTPWLAQEENLSLIGEILEMELELEAEEKSVGPFRADILCRDARDGSWVLIENQLERSDHTHLGQLLTYAAGLDAVTIVWIAQRFTEEHRAALDWLNEQTPEGIGFFGLEVELWRIGDSPPAPKFNVISRPNEWTRKVIRTRSVDPTRADMCHHYWSGVLERLEPMGILQGPAKAHRIDHYRYPVGWPSEFWLKSYLSTAKSKTGVWVACRGEHFAENFQTLLENKAEIESAFGGPLNWDKFENQASCGTNFSGCDPTRESDWPRQHTMLAEKLAALHRAVDPIIKRINGGRSECESP